MPEGSLSGLDKGQVAEIVEFLTTHIKNLLELLMLEEGIPSDRFAQVLDWHTARTGGRFQTPQCVSRPKILPAPDLIVARELLQDLRSLRRRVYEHMKWAKLRGAPDSIDRVTDELLSAISAARDVLEIIHSERIVFAGERLPDAAGPDAASVVNRIDSDKIDTAVMAGTIGVINNYQSAAEGELDLSKLIRASVEIVPGSWHADLVVDCDSPHAVTPSGSVYVITIRTLAKMPVVLQRARPVIVDRWNPRSVCVSTHVTGRLHPRRFTTDLDAERPRLHPEGAPFPFTIHSQEVEQFWIEPVTRIHEVSWKLEIDLEYDSKPWKALIGSPGGPFEIYPQEASRSLRTECDLSGHRKGCPALKLREIDPHAPRSTFSFVRDTQNECWLVRDFL